MTKEIIRYAIVDENGIVMACSASEKDAVYSRCNKAGCTIVKLTGQIAVAQKRMKKVAQYVYLTTLKSILASGCLLTEEDAKQLCVGCGAELIKWPYGEIIEVPE
jgi:hypothetical protein